MMKSVRFKRRSYSTHITDSSRCGDLLLVLKVYCLLVLVSVTCGRYIDVRLTSYHQTTWTWMMMTTTKSSTIQAPLLRRVLVLPPFGQPPQTISDVFLDHPDAQPI